MKIILKKLTIPLFFTTFGLLFFTIGARLTFRQHKLEKQGQEAQGIVVSLRENHESDGSTYTPVVQFTTSNGKTTQFESSYSSNPPAYDIGETVRVVYPPDDPTHAIINGEGQILHIIFMLLGGIVICVGYVQVFTSIRNMATIQSEE